MVKSNVHLLRIAESLIQAGDSTTPGDSATVDTPALLGMVRNALMLAGNANQQLNQYRRDSLKLSNHMRQLAKDAPEEDVLLFGDDLDKRITSVQATEKTAKLLEKPEQKHTGFYPHNRPYDNRYRSTKDNFRHKEKPSYTSFKNQPSKNAKTSSKENSAPRRLNYKRGGKQ